jgi:hypothetical protein
LVFKLLVFIFPAQIPLLFRILFLLIKLYRSRGRTKYSENGKIVHLFWGAPSTLLLFDSCHGRRNGGFGRLAGWRSINMSPAQRRERLPQEMPGNYGFQEEKMLLFRIL